MMRTSGDFTAYAMLRDSWVIRSTFTPGPELDLVAGDRRAAGEAGDGGVHVELLEDALQRVDHLVVGPAAGLRRVAGAEQVGRRQLVVGVGEGQLLGPGRQRRVLRRLSGLVAWARQRRRLVQRLQSTVDDGSSSGSSASKCPAGGGPAGGAPAPAPAAGRAPRRSSSSSTVDDRSARPTQVSPAGRSRYGIMLIGVAVTTSNPNSANRTSSRRRDPGVTAAASSPPEPRPTTAARAAQLGGRPGLGDRCSSPAPPTTRRSSRPGRGRGAPPRPAGASSGRHRPAAAPAAPSAIAPTKVRAAVLASRAERSARVEPDRHGQHQRPAISSSPPPSRRCSGRVPWHRRRPGRRPAPASRRRAPGPSRSAPQPADHIQWARERSAVPAPGGAPAAPGSRAGRQRAANSRRGRAAPRPLDMPRPRPA